MIVSFLNKNILDLASIASLSLKLHMHVFDSSIGLKAYVFYGVLSDLVDKLYHVPTIITHATVFFNFLPMVISLFAFFVATR